ncbi:uncharacterized protein si:ch211-13f8.1 [Tachysurus fulvidraco]|uniref:uncharacterized protein si:ch211-13f8.1 n=1 Tax=Tachysurus fulvidraco TaxID=1234273 RepID=UPI001FEE3C7F|nr:uncharacterized protein si:ch211-13f8.1 [Tachysurus fulvidraco]
METQWHEIAPRSDGCCNSHSDSAVSALQSKFKEISQRRSKGKEMPDVPLEGPSEPLQKKSDKEPSSLSIPEVKFFKSSAGSDVVPEVQNRKNKEKKQEMEGDLIPSFDSSLGGGSRMDSLTTSEDGGTILSKTISSQRYRTTLKSFWRAAHPKTIVSNREVASLPITMKNLIIASEEEQKLRLRGNMVHKDLPRSESAFEKPFQKEQIPPDESEREEISESEKAHTTKPILVMLAEGQYQPPLVNKDLPPSYKASNWEPAIITGTENNVRADFILSPRHEQAKRLLERARLKARSQYQNCDHGTQTTQREVAELLPVHNTPPQIITATHEQKLSLPVQPQDVRRRNREHNAYLRRRGQLFGDINFEDESKKETERHYLDKVCKRRLGLMDSSLSYQQIKAGLPLIVEQGVRGLGSSQGSVEIPSTIPTNQGEPSLETLLCKDKPKKCEACGSILMSSHPKEPSQNAKGQKSSDKPLTSGQSSHQIIQPNLLEATILTGSSSLDENDEAAGPSDAGERVSAFGKLRRRSRKGENRVETSHGPYARGQDLLAQRRNSRTRSSLEEVAGPRSKPARGVTFAIDSFIPTVTSSRNYRDIETPSLKQLPIKSALKSGSKSRPSDLQGVKYLSSVQEVERSLHYAASTPQDLGAPSQVSQVSSGLTPCIKPSSLRYSSPVGTPVEPVDALTPSEDPTCAASHPSDCRPIVRGIAMSKTEDLRAELLRSEHRKAELQWDVNFCASRRTLEKEGRTKLSLRRFFSAMGLNSMGMIRKGSRSSSMEHLSLSSARSSPSPTHKGQSLLQRTPSLQALHTESPLAQLRKASSVQSLQSPKKKYECSAVLGDLHLPLILGPRDLHVNKGMEIVDTAQISGPMGRIIQTFPDSSLLLELTRPDNAPFGFVISRGKGRPDSGIYVEQVAGSSTENIYTSLLGVGDEILEVNGEKVTGLSLDQVTCLMTCESTATVRILPHRWIQH